MADAGSRQAAHRGVQVDRCTGFDVAAAPRRGHMARALVSACLVLFCISPLTVSGAATFEPHPIFDLTLRKHGARSVAVAAAPRPAALAGMQASLSSDGLNYVKRVLVQQVR